MFRQNFRLFVKNKRVFVPALLLLLYVTGYLVYLCVRYTIYSIPHTHFLQEALKNCFPAFIVLFYTSYELFYLPEGANAKEALFSHRDARGRIFGGMSAVICLIPALLFLITAALNIIYCALAGISDGSYYLYFISMLFLYFFLGGIIPIFIGALFSQKFKRVSSYALAALIIFVLSDISDFLPGSISNMTEINFWPFKYIFAYILPSDVNWGMVSEYGWGCEIYRWNIVLFWIFLLGFLLLRLCRLKSKGIRLASGAIVLAFIAASFVGFIRGGSHIELGNQFDSDSMESHFYNKHNVPKTKTADFKVDNYDMKLNIWRQLEADITMSLSKKSLDKYDFTLFHGYKVNRVSDENGNELRFDREGDYLTVYSSGKLSSLNIKYGGYSPVLYSSSQGCILPGCFPYYPIPGFYDFLLNACYMPICDLDKARFEIAVDSPRRFYSNLDEGSNKGNSFSGESSCPTLISGFYKEDSAFGHKVIGTTAYGSKAPAIDGNYAAELQALINKYSSGASIDLSKYTIIDSLAIANGIYNSANGLIYLCDDLIIINSALGGDARDGLARDIIEADKKGFKEYITEIKRQEDEETRRLLAELY